jgi:hypothetical protein
LAAAVGAVQARGNIRLRRLPDGGQDGRTGEISEAAERMTKEYVSPSGDDVLWADGLVFCPSTGSGGAWTGYLDLLGRMSAGGKLDGKIAAVVAPATGSEAVLSASILRLGFIVLPPSPAAPAAPAEDAGDAIDAIDAAQIQGRRLAMLVRALDGKTPTWGEAHRLR